MNRLLLNNKNWKWITFIIEMVNLFIYCILLLEFLLCHTDIQESYCENNTKFNFLGIIWESKMSWRINFSGFPHQHPKFLKCPHTFCFDLLFCLHNNFQMKKLMFWDQALIESWFLPTCPSKDGQKYVWSAHMHTYLCHT